MYTSRATRFYTAADLGQLQARAAERNAQADVTGLLLYDGARFIQALEGREADARAIMRRICLDGGHTQIDTVSSGPIAARQFGAWSMHVRHPGDGHDPQTFVARIKRDIADVRDRALKAAFIGFAVLATGQPQEA